MRPVPALTLGLALLAGHQDLSAQGAPRLAVARGTTAPPAAPPRPNLPPMIPPQPLSPTDYGALRQTLAKEFNIPLVLIPTGLAPAKGLSQPGSTVTVSLGQFPENGGLEARGVRWMQNGRLSNSTTSPVLIFGGILAPGEAKRQLHITVPIPGAGVYLVTCHGQSSESKLALRLWTAGGTPNNSSSQTWVDFNGKGMLAFEVTAPDAKDLNLELDFEAMSAQNPAGAYFRFHSCEFSRIK